jgi:hypothetical protein
LRSAKPTLSTELFVTHCFVRQGYPERTYDLRTFGFIEELQQSGAYGGVRPPEE